MLQVEQFDVADPESGLVAPYLIALQWTFAQLTPGNTKVSLTVYGAIRPDRAARITSCRP